MLDLIAVPYRSLDPWSGDDVDEKDEVRSETKPGPKSTQENELSRTDQPQDLAHGSDERETRTEHSHESKKSVNSTLHKPNDSTRHRGIVRKELGNADETSPHERPTFTIRIEMPFETGIRSWRFYEAIIETLAVGIYLYATFVLTSLMFLSGSEAILYACVLILSLAVVRLLSLLF